MEKLLAVLFFCAKCHAQTVYISTLASPVPDRLEVEQAINAWNSALGIDLSFSGYTQQPCVDGAITYRMPSVSEWIAATGDYWLHFAAAVFACQPERNFSGAVVLNSPIFGNPIAGIYTHELGHAIGARHVADSSAVMYSGVVTATEITPADIRAVVDCTPWLGTDGVLRVPSMDYAGIRYAVQLSPVVNGLWYVTRRADAIPGCIWNFQLPNGELTLWEVVAGGIRYDVRLVPSGLYWKIGTVHRF